MDENKLKLTEMRPEKTLDLYDLLAMKRRREEQLIEEMSKDAKDQKNSKRSSLKQTAQELKKKQ